MAPVSIKFPYLIYQSQSISSLAASSSAPSVADYTLIRIDNNIADIAQQIIEMGILTKKSYDDCQHIGAAIVSECDCIISWNFKHIVNIKTIRGVRAITNLKRVQLLLYKGHESARTHRLL